MAIFGFLRKQPAVQEPAKNIAVSELDRFLADRLSVRISSARNEAKSMQSNILKLAEELSRHIDSLDKAEFGDRTEYAMVNMTKGNFVKRARHMLGEMKDTKLETYTDISRFAGNISGLLSELNASTPKEGILISRYFGQHATKIVSCINGMEKESRALKDFAASRGRDMERFEKILESRVHILSYTSRIKGLAELVRDAEGKIEKLKEDILSAEKRSDQWKSSEAAALEKNKDRADRIWREMVGIRNEAINTVSFLENPLKKLKHMTGDKFLSSYFEAPFESVLEMGDDFKKTIDTLKQFLSQNKIELDGKSKKKAETGIASLPNMSALLEKYRHLRIEKENVDADIGEAEKKISAFLEEINTIKAKRKELELEIAGHLKETGGLRILVEKEKAAAESALAELLGRTSLILPEV
jgi:predicted  nucleic acid-binding Zn-ribbon protein